jgi:hypothetical protein
LGLSDLKQTAILTVYGEEEGVAFSAVYEFRLGVGYNCLFFFSGFHVFRK